GGTRFGKRNLVGRLADFGSFYAAAALKLATLPLPDVILALTSPPMISSLAAAMTRLREHADGRRVRLVYHVMDLYPDAAVASGVMRDRSLVERLCSRITARTLERSDAVIALGRDMRDRLHARFGRSAAQTRIEVVTPWAAGEALRPL